MLTPSKPIDYVLSSELPNIPYATPKYIAWFAFTLAILCFLDSRPHLIVSPHTATPESDNFE